MVRRYSNRPDLLEQLRKVVVILSNDGQDGDMGTEMPTESVIRSRRLRDRFFREDLQTMIDLYRSGTTARQVAEKFGVSLRSVKRLLHQHGVRRERLPNQAQKSYNLKEKGQTVNEYHHSTNGSYLFTRAGGTV